MLTTSMTIGSFVGQPTENEIEWINEREWNEFPPIPIDPDPTPEPIPPEPEPEPEHYD